MSRRKQRIVRRVAPFVVAGLVLLTAGAALAQGPPVVNETDHVVNETSVQIDVHPCTGRPAELTVTESGVIHFSAFADGTVHFTGTLRGTFSADALPPTESPTLRGRRSSGSVGTESCSRTGMPSARRRARSR